VAVENPGGDEVDGQGRPRRPRASATIDLRRIASRIPASIKIQIEIATRETPLRARGEDLGGGSRKSP